MVVADRRPLTANEMKFFRYVFGLELPLRNIEVVRRPGLGGGFTPFGTVNVSNKRYEDDYIGPNMFKPSSAYYPPPPMGNISFGDPIYDIPHFFLHELGHVWQYFVGMPMAHARATAMRHARRMVRAADQPKVVDGMRMRKEYIHDAAYRYDPTTGQDLADYNMEQQCEIIADYFALIMWNRTIPEKKGYAVATRQQLEDILENFLADRTYVMHDRALWRARAAVRGLDRS
jgi:hypothetical protein